MTIEEFRFYSTIDQALGLVFSILLIALVCGAVANFTCVGVKQKLGMIAGWSALIMLGIMIGFMILSSKRLVAKVHVKVNPLATLASPIQIGDVVKLDRASYLLFSGKGKTGSGGLLPPEVCLDDILHSRSTIKHAVDPTKTKIWMIDAEMRSMHLRRSKGALLEVQKWDGIWIGELEGISRDDLKMAEVFVVDPPPAPLPKP